MSSSKRWVRIGFPMKGVQVDGFPERGQKPAANRHAQENLAQKPSPKPQNGRGRGEAVQEPGGRVGSGRHFRSITGALESRRATYLLGMLAAVPTEAPGLQERRAVRKRQGCLRRCVQHWERGATGTAKGAVCSGRERGTEGQPTELCTGEVLC